MSRIKDFTRLYVIYRQCHGQLSKLPAMRGWYQEDEHDKDTL